LQLRCFGCDSDCVVVRRVESSLLRRDSVSREVRRLAMPSSIRFIVRRCSALTACNAAESEGGDDGEVQDERSRSTSS
jgi:hypothetical protein